MKHRKTTVKALLVGASLLVGSFAVAHAMQHRDPSKMMEKRIERMKTDLNLSDAQVSQIKTIYKQNETTMKSDFDAMKAADKGSDAQKAAREKMHGDMKDIQAQVKQVLTPDQQTKLHDQMAQRKEHWKDHDGDRNGGNAQPESK
ncbi:MAG TPA: Spy/CpxP family protein refolding chaperone [Candidatus Kapabacteria bacterium]|jgi:Spy/CpxP family protein refolding chaperone|nr:Spy/CpxP family protein refolding chaperone [Candidatus Kapabacteria bacterium]